MSFRIKTILGVALIEAILLVLLVTEALNFLYATNSQALFDRAHSTAKQFSLSVQNDVISEDLASLESSVAALYESKDVVYCRILSTSGGVLAESGDAQLLAVSFDEDTAIGDVTDGVLDVQIPVEVEGYAFGEVQMGFSTAPLTEIIEKSRTEMVFIALAEMGLVALFSFFLGTYLTRQLQALRDGAQRLAEGALGTTLPVSGSDELADTARSFNHMSTELLRSEQQILEQSQLFQDLVQTSSDWFWTTDTDGRIDSLSSGFYASVRAPEKDIIGRDWSDVIDNASSDQSGQAKRVQRSVEEQQVFRDIIYKWTDHSGAERWINLNGKPAQDAEGQYVGFRGTGRDVTDAVVREQQLTQANLLAREGLRAKDRFLANMSHELRTPLNAVLGMHELLRNANLTDQERVYLDNIKGGGKALLNIVSEILEVARLEDEQIELIEQPFDLVSLVEQAVEPFEESARQRNNTLRWQIEPRESVTLVGDVARLRRVITNLLSNATKFCYDGAIEITTKLLPVSGYDHVLLHFAIKDTGIGIAAGDLDRVFDPFFQVDTSSKREYGGTGLGLTIMKRIVNGMQGKYGIESKPRMGTSVWFEVPLTRSVDTSEDVEIDSGDYEARIANRGGGPLRILVAEDNPMNLLLIRKILERTGAKVTVANNGQEAVQAVQQDLFDIVLMDIQMPEMDGIEATQYIRRHIASKRQLPILAVTANAMDGDREKYFAAGMDGYVSKPIDKNVLFSEIERLAPSDKKDSTLPDASRHRSGNSSDS